jgi:hypothetical protein
MVVLDGQIKDLPPTGDALDEATYNQVIALFKAGLLVDPTTSEVIPWLDMVYLLDDLSYNNFKLAGVLPFSSYMVGGPLPTSFDVISDYVANHAHHLWDLFGLGEGLLTNYNGGYIDRGVLVKALNEFSRYYPARQTFEDSQMLAYDDVPYFDYDDNDIYLPAIAFLSRLGCQNVCLIDVIPNMTLSDDVTINFLQGYGHMDVLFGQYSLTDVKQPLLNWLNDHMDEGSSQVLSWQSPEYQFVDSLVNLIKPLFEEN